MTDRPTCLSCCSTKPGSWRPGSFASPEAIAHLMTQKFVMGSPLYRQAQEWERRGIPLSRQTMSNWLLQSTEAWLLPVYDALREQFKTGKAAQSKSCMWLYRTGRYDRQSQSAAMPIVLYEYQPDRKARKGSGPWQGKRYCDRLFAIEKSLAELTPEDRLPKRQELAQPVLDEFLSWLESQRLVKSAFGL